MPNPTPDPELLRSLGKLTRGLSALFWGLPTALIVCAETARLTFIQPFEIVPALAVNALLLYALWQMSSFQRQERPWRNVLDRAKLFGMVNLGLCPFLFWFNRMPGQDYFRAVIFLLVVSAMLFLFNLNVVLKQLGAMLPDETLRQDINLFTALNRWMLVLWVLMVAVVIGAPKVLPISMVIELQLWLGRAEFAVLLFLGLAPLSITMALIWKTKEVIFNSVFGAK
ncbi:MAG TPA: hypothetical protein VH280_14320 [Verrucomicrobiae bacterium]|jgi:hypothetical protein|nr:hypothetical protein [Verrucomicrobiae bacterium]